MSPFFLAALFTVAVLSGSTAAIAGFGIGSLLTPLLALEVGTATAVAAVSIPHAAATALRFWRLRRSVDVHVLRRFGILSAVGGLAGAFAYTRASGNTLTIVLGVLLLVTAIATLGDLASRWSPSGPVVALLGFASGAFGGLAGNQGGLRAAALLSFRLSPAAYVATATAVGLLVDAARTPVYAWRAGESLSGLTLPLSVATIGVLIGTLLGERVLFGLTPDRFRRIVASLVGALGIWLVMRAV